MNADLVLQLLILAISKAESLAALYNKAKSEDRDVTQDELTVLGINADASGQALQDWIDAKKATPPSP